MNQENSLSKNPHFENKNQISENPQNGKHSLEKLEKINLDSFNESIKDEINAVRNKIQFLNDKNTHIPESIYQIIETLEKKQKPNTISQDSVRKILGS